MMASLVRRLGVVMLLAESFTACRSAQPSGKPRLTFFEYNRGASSPGHSDLVLRGASGETRFQNVQLEGQSFYDDNSVIPNSFIGPLARFQFGKALNAFTEPYYGYRVVHYFARHPAWAIGGEFTHHKVFMADPDQVVAVTGLWPGIPVGDGRTRIGDQFKTFNVSHGVNHISVIGQRRWMLAPTERVPDGRLQPYVSFGAGPAVPHLELEAVRDGQVRRLAYGYNAGLGNWGVGAGGGVRWRLTDRFGVYGEYKWTYSHLGDMTVDDGSETNAQMQFVSNHAMWGVSFGF